MRGGNYAPGIRSRDVQAIDSGEAFEANGMKTLMESQGG
jgi:hypothetical protein